LGTDAIFHLPWRERKEDIPHTRNHWLCYNFKQKWFLPRHYAIRTNGCAPGQAHLRSWLVETSTDGEEWREVPREEGNKQLNGKWFTATVAVTGGGKCHFIRFGNIDRNQSGTDALLISAWELFGSLIK
jgi:hypothetical protein